MAQTMSENAMPCHCQIDYDDPDWRDTQLPDAPLCGGALVFLKNICKLPRDPALAEAVKSVEADRETVFSRPNHFIEHHMNSILKKKS